jgi:hypothetical protein
MASWDSVMVFPSAHKMSKLQSFSVEVIAEALHDARVQDRVQLFTIGRAEQSQAYSGHQFTSDWRRPYCT